MQAAEARTWTRESADFVSRGLRCSAWLYRPADGEPAPIVVMAHGFAAEKTFRLPPFAERFASAGMAVLLFDYRSLGESEGEPRYWVSSRRHLEDWEAAIAHAKTLDRVDGARMALWGSSFSGGHVVVMASRHPELRAVVAQVPFADGRATLGDMKPGYIAWLVASGLRDLARILTGRPAYTIPVIGKVGERAVMNTPRCWEGYRAIVPKGSDWPNRCPARIGLTIGSYRPTRVAARVTCPALVLMAERDQIIPCSSVEDEVAKMPQGELLRFDCDHFEPYHEEPFERFVSAECNFLVRHLGLARREAA